MHLYNKKWLIALTCIGACGTAIVAIHTNSQRLLEALMPGKTRALVIAPHIAGISFCPSAFLNKGIQNNDQASQYCFLKQETASKTVEELLRKLDLGGKRRDSQFRLGYTLTLPLSRYYKRNQDSRWLVDIPRIDYDLRIATELERPVHIYLNFNHFAAGNTEFVRDIADNKNNLMWNAYGPLPVTNYYGIDIIPWTLTNLQAPISKYKEQILRLVLSRVAKIYQDYPGRIIGVSLLGESHHLDPDLSAGPSYSVDLITTTDYSPYAIKQFQHFLQSRYITIQKLNQASSVNYSNFSEILPYQPQSNQRNKATVWRDSYSNTHTGLVDFYGWFLDLNSSCQPELQVHLNNARIASTPVNLNRTDVAEALETANPNLGFRYSLDVKKLEPGQHHLNIFAVCNGAHVPVARRGITVQSTHQESPQSSFHQGSPNRRVSAQIPAGVKFNLDGPSDSLLIRYNPISDLWHQYRRMSVRRYVEHYARIANEYLPADLIYSYQISTNYNGSWNSQVTAESDSNLPSKWYQYGASLYGGAAFGEPFFDDLKRYGIRSYAVTETNPMSNLGVPGYVAFLDKHRRAGAVFVAPYYLSVISDHLPSGELGFFELRPGNTSKYGDQFYRAIKNIMKSNQR
jgi:hypothetical protein